MLPHIMAFNLIGNPNKFAQIAGAMSGEVEGLSDMEAAPLALEAVKELLNQLKIPIRLRDYGIPQKDMPRLAEGGNEPFSPFCAQSQECNPRRRGGNLSDGLVIPCKRNECQGKVNDSMIRGREVIYRIRKT